MEKEIKIQGKAEQVEGWKARKLQREKRRVEAACRDDTRRDVMKKVEIEERHKQKDYTNRKAEDNKKRKQKNTGRGVK